MKILAKYNDLYFETDAFLLTDVLEELRFI